MTNTLATIALEYDGTDLQPSNLSFSLEIVAGLDDAAEVRGEDTIVPYRAGRIPRPRRFDRRRILLVGWVMGQGDDQESRRLDYRSSRRILAELFDPEAAVADLRVVVEGGDVARIECRTLPGGIDVVEIIQSEYATVTIELEAVSDWEGLGS